MRVSTLQIHRNGLANMLSNQEALTKTQQQVSSGVRVNTAADDPIAAARILQIEQQLAHLHEEMIPLAPEARAALMPQLDQMIAVLSLRQAKTREARAALQAQKNAATQKSRGGMVYAKRHLKRG